LYPGAAEGGGCFVPTLRPDPSLGRSWAEEELPPEEEAARALAAAERAQSEAGRRAKGKLRRYCAANRTNRLWTLTYAGAGCFDHGELRSDVAVFFKGLRRELGRPFPYAWAAEWHPGGHGLHVHFAVARYVRHGLIKRVWGRGRVHVKLFTDLAVGSGALEEARVAGGYLAKYVGKAFGDDRIPGRHRYEVGQGFQPEKVVLRAASPEAVIALASERMGSEPSRRWSSNDVEGWRASPALWCAWSV
jgi:hypothetical protein